MEWRPVPWALQYEISEDGQLRREKWTGGYFYQKRQLTDRGYYKFTLCQKGKKPVVRTAARLVAEAFIGPRPTDLTVNHKDGDKKNDHWTNLEYLTRLENFHHAMKLGLLKVPHNSGPWKPGRADRWSEQMRQDYKNGKRKPLRGGDNPNSKLNTEQWHAVAEAVKSGQSRRSIARELGVSHTIIIAYCKNLLDNP